MCEYDDLLISESKTQFGEKLETPRYLKVGSSLLAETRKTQLSELHVVINFWFSYGWRLGHQELAVTPLKITEVQMWIWKNSIRMTQSDREGLRVSSRDDFCRRRGSMMCGSETDAMAKAQANAEVCVTANRSSRACNRKIYHNWKPLYYANIKTR